MRILSKILGIFLPILYLIGNQAFASNSDTLNVVVELEVKITQKVKAIIQSIDPDAIVTTEVSIKKVNTQLAGTQMTAVGLFATGDTQKIEDADIDTITVHVYTSVDEFPKEVSRMVESSIMSITKKGRVQISKMDKETSDIISKRKEYSKIQAEGFQKIGSYAEQLSRVIFIAVGSALAGLAIILLVLSVIQMRFQAKAISNLAEKISSIKPNDPIDYMKNAQLSAPEQHQMLSPPESRQALPAPDHSENHKLEDFSTPSLRNLIADAYWCNKDSYASWIWTKLAPDRKVQLLTAWPALQTYVSYLSNIDPQPDRYHFDASYLKPQDNYQISNDDLMKWLRENKSAWSEISRMRKEALELSLKERIDFANAKIDSAKAGASTKWTQTPSPERKLPMQVELVNFSDHDEAYAYVHHQTVPASLRRQMHSLIWLALLPLAEREKLLQFIPAQSLAEIWIGPVDALAKISESLPEKKRELIQEYQKTVKPDRNSKWMKNLSLAAIALLEKTEAPGTGTETKVA